MIMKKMGKKYKLNKKKVFYKNCLINLSLFNFYYFTDRYSFSE